MIGFFGGSFDPVHYGHLLTARAIKQELGLDKLFLMPCNPVHKSSLFFSDKQRLEMLNLALNEFADLSLDRREINSSTPSYSIDTLRQIKQKYPNKKIFFIIGGDSFAALDTWKNYQQLSQFAQLVVLPRKGADLHSESKVYFAKTPLVEASSTQIRKILFELNCKNKRPNFEQFSANLSALTPDSIIRYLYENPVTTAKTDC
ncbi:MAG: nicotinate (nicotinamide) nucleotide adenylyltransferase [Candidatus Thioglobus sp.]|nr:nicotinate (nicotinamide) nucleotide adenylyltransferase [Candidatus Thioglobus sp.]